MDSVIRDKLLSFQVAHTLQLNESLSQERCVLDASDTGTGKTYCAAALCKLRELRPFIICPKSVINTWINTCKIFDVKIFGISNYEMLKSGKYYTENLELAICPYFDKILDKKKSTYIFQLPQSTIIIFDEAHRCKNSKTSTSEILAAASATTNKVLLISATLADKIELFKPFGHIFGLYDKRNNFKSWMTKQQLMNKVIFDNMEKKGDRLTLNQKESYIINRVLFPKYGSRLKIKELGDLFPQNNITSQSYYLENFKEVDKLYQIINEAMEELKNKETRAEALGKIIRARQRIELLKVPIIQDLAEEALDGGYSVVIFVNYRATMLHLSNLLKSGCLIHGEQTLNEREDNIKDFQSNKSKIIIAMITAGNVGISLHDTIGGHPRMSILNPSWNATDMKQALGRIHRAGSKSPSIQKIVFCAKTYEDHINKIIESKFKTLSGINDGDLVGPNIPVEKINEINELTADESAKYKGGFKD
jgi:SNF2 family DNA or RNA helicase